MPSVLQKVETYKELLGELTILNTPRHRKSSGEQARETDAKYNDNGELNYGLLDAGLNYVIRPADEIFTAPGADLLRNEMGGRSVSYYLKGQEFNVY